MAIARLIRRAAPLIVVGVAGAAARRRRADRLRQAHLAPPSYPPPAPETGPVAEPEPEPLAEPAPAPVPEPSPEPEPEPPADEQPTVEQTALEPAARVAPAPHDEPVAADLADASSVMEIVDDLLAPGGPEETIQDATVVEGSAEEEASSDDGTVARGR